jgi:hypothetical protein
VYRQPGTLDAGPGRQVGHGFEGGDVVRPAIRVTGIVDRIDADEDVAAAQHLGPGQRQRQHDGVARGHVSDRNARLHTSGRDGDPGVGQRRAAELCESQIEGAVLDGTECPGDFFGGFELGAVALAIVEGQAVAGMALAARDGKARGGIEATGKEDDSRLHGPAIYPKSAPE